MNDTSESTFSGFWNIIKKRWWLFILLPVVTAVAIFIISATAEPEYIASERLQIIPNDTLVVPLFSRAPVLTTAQQIQSVHDDFYDVVRNPSVAWKTIADLNLDMSADELISRIDTQHLSEFITVSARMPSPELAQEVVTTHTQNAINTFRKIRVNPAQSTLDFLNSQVEAQARVLADAREALQKFQLEHEVSRLPDEIAAAQDFQRQLTAERDRLSTESASAKAMAETYQQQAEESRKQAEALRSDMAEALSLSASGPITKTETAEETAENAPEATPEPAPETDAKPAASTAVTVTPEEVVDTMAQVKALLTQVDDLESKAQEQAIAATGYDAAIDDYNRILDEREQQIVFLLGLQEQYAQLQNDLESAQGSYDFLVDKTNEASLKVAQGSQGYLEVVTPARAPNAANPKNTLQIILVGILGSLLLALLLAFLLEIVDRGAGGGSQT